ncbi:hypothetical protein [Polyangium sp. 15x6]|uniref:hypothetical protein n=1 Tax=Polyangium sp. 15x6 TaxID=3042687 RepID=UPI00249A00EB|nr:hypothetical protein [Polyangium sp. 15x6]
MITASRVVPRPFVPPSRAHWFPSNPLPKMKEFDLHHTQLVVPQGDVLVHAGYLCGFGDLDELAPRGSMS